MTAPAFARPGKRAMLAPWVRLVREPSVEQPDRLIREPADVYRWLKDEAAREEVECFWLLTLNAQNKVTARSLITRGVLNSSLVHPREVFRLAIAYGAASIIVAHNHPSGNPAPSADDRAITTQLVEAGRMLDIPVYDHVILAADTYFSFAEAGLL